MTEKNVVRPRTCIACGQTLETTAKGIKDHFKECVK